MAGLAVSIGVPILLAYVYGVVPISLCRSEGCGVSTGTNGGVKIEIDEEEDANFRHAGRAAFASDAVFKLIDSY
jgi:E3 ubiquitin-protein ligase RNF19A